MSSVPPPPGCDPDSIVLSFRVAKEQAGQRLDRYIQSRIPRLSRTRAQQIVKACARRADGRPRRASERVREGETVLVVRPRLDEPETPREFSVLYEDEDVLVVDKPAGLPMHPTATYHRNTLTYLLRERYGEHAPHIAHRLDRETSGIVVCGRHLEAERALKRAFENRETDKTYLAIVEGEIPRAHGRIDRPLAPVTGAGGGDPRRERALHVLMQVAEDGAPAVSHFEVRERRDGRSLVALRPETGRQHQLRVHMAALGHPIVGDKLYGPAGPEVFLEYIETGMTPELAARAGHARQALHAHELTIGHPRTGRPLTVRSELPEELRALWLAAADGAAGRLD